ncbi:MAG TPA: hypothetical protein VKQ36_01415 [Ktedonobacterales bacterium]|nr:hypothetical protein [Ktedonobacterales bacterium]
MQVYGYGYTLDHVCIKNGYSGGVLSDWNGSSTLTTIDDSMEAQFSALKIHACGGPGLEFGGPHDSQFSNILIYDCVNTAFTGTGNLTPGLHIAPNAPGVLLHQVHVWDCNLSFLLETPFCCVNCIADVSARGSNPGTGVLWLASEATWYGGRVFGASGSQATTTGVIIGQQAGQTTLSPYMIQQTTPGVSGGTTHAVSVIASVLDTLLTTCDAGHISFANDGGGGNAWRARIRDSNSGAVGLIGQWNSGSRVDIGLSGIASDGTMQKGGGSLISLDSQNALRFTTGTSDAVNIDTHSKRIQMPNNANLRGYSDDYSTSTWSINKNSLGEMIASGYIAVGQSANAQVVVSNGTITVSGIGAARVAPTANVTGVAMQAGTQAGQQVTVINESAYTLTFDVAGSSNVADGTADVIPANAARSFIWDSGGAGLWYRLA